MPYAGICSIDSLSNKTATNSGRYRRRSLLYWGRTREIERLALEGSCW
nr:MAG TPA: hypothetical protein [Caudoviricetes sp.]